MNRTRTIIVSIAITLQAIHFVMFWIFRETAVLSNVLQILIALLAAGSCWYKGWPSRGSKQPWIFLSWAFFIWMIAQIFFLSTLLGAGSKWESSADILWLLFPFPMILVASRFPHLERHEVISWLDLVQAGLFFSTLFALVYISPKVITLSVAYEVQSIALALSFSLRFSLTSRGKDRRFYKNVSIFTILYAVFSICGYILEDHGVASGGLIDNCWTIPFTAFTVMVMLPANFLKESRKVHRLSDPIHLQGISALGLAAMSLGASGIFAWHRHFYGGLTVALSFLLFATRIVLREWQSHRFHAQLETAALHDPLTGLGNRTLLRKVLNAAIEEAHEDDRFETAVLFIDIDRFKSINDDLGHSFGDELLKQVGRLLRSSVRAQDTVARQGGDEFIILLRRLSHDEAISIAHKVLATLRIPITIEARVTHVSGSIGVVFGGHESTADMLLRDADCAMYSAKQAGRDCLRVFTPDMLEAARQRAILLGDLRDALTNGGIEVHYQPLCTVNDGVVVGFEALARWRHPKNGMVSPADFIPLAEESGLINDLGQQVLRQACFQCRKWNSEFNANLSVSVNVSALQFADSSLLPRVIRTLDESGLPPSLLKLEITESVLLSGYAGVENVLAEIRSLGVSICLDDFGTGYSSLTYLLKFPFDVLKIDKSFVQGLDHEFARAELVSSILHLSRKLNMQVIAEGVETTEELLRLKELECDMVQGFLFSKPLDAESVNQRLRTDWLPVKISKMLMLTERLLEIDPFSLPLEETEALCEARQAAI